MKWNQVFKINMYRKKSTFLKTLQKRKEIRVSEVEHKHRYTPSAYG